MSTGLDLLADAALRYKMATLEYDLALKACDDYEDGRDAVFQRLTAARISKANAEAQLQLAARERADESSAS